MIVYKRFAALNAVLSHLKTTNVKNSSRFSDRLVQFYMKSSWKVLWIALPEALSRKCFIIGQFSYVLFNDLQSVTSVSLSFSLIHLNELWTHLSANSLPIQLLPIRPAKTVCQRTVDSSQRFFHCTQQYNNY